MSLDSHDDRCLDVKELPYGSSFFIQTTEHETHIEPRVITWRTSIDNLRYVPIGQARFASLIKLLYQLHVL